MKKEIFTLNEATSLEKQIFIFFIFFNNKREKKNYSSYKMKSVINMDFKNNAQEI